MLPRRYDEKVMFPLVTHLAMDQNGPSLKRGDKNHQVYSINIVFIIVSFFSQQLVLKQLKLSLQRMVYTLIIMLIIHRLFSILFLL